MQRHLPATELKRDGRARTFNNSAACCLQHRLDPRPLDVSTDGVGEYLLQGLAVSSVHAEDDSRRLLKCNHSMGKPAKAQAAKPIFEIDRRGLARPQFAPLDAIRRAKGLRRSRNFGFLHPNSAGTIRLLQVLHLRAARGSQATRQAQRRAGPHDTESTPAASPATRCNPARCFGPQNIGLARSKRRATIFSSYRPRLFASPRPSPAQF